MLRRLEDELQQFRSDCESMKLAMQHKDEIHREKRMLLAWLNTADLSIPLLELSTAPILILCSQVLIFSA